MRPHNMVQSGHCSPSVAAFASVSHAEARGPGPGAGAGVDTQDHPERCHSFPVASAVGAAQPPGMVGTHTRAAHAPKRGVDSTRPCVPLVALIGGKWLSAVHVPFTRLCGGDEPRGPNSTQGVCIPWRAAQGERRFQAVVVVSAKGGGTSTGPRRARGSSNTCLVLHEHAAGCVCGL